MFTYFIPLTVNLTKNSKLEKFVHEQNALWKLSGSSMGALRELVAVAGIVILFCRVVLSYCCVVVLRYCHVVILFCCVDDVLIVICYVVVH
jgi:hypothetical protein